MNEIKTNAAEYFRFVIREKSESFSYMDRCVDVRVINKKNNELNPFRKKANILFPKVLNVRFKILKNCVCCWEKTGFHFSAI